MQKDPSPKNHERRTASKEISETPPPNFIRSIIEEDFKTNKFGGKVATRFPPNRTDTCTSATPNQSV